MGLGFFIDWLNIKLMHKFCLFVKLIFTHKAENIA